MENPAPRRKVLLADDSDSFLELEGSFFESEEVDILTARSGDEALRVIRSERPDLVLIDESMPGLLGHEVCGAVKGDAALRDIPVVIVTAATGPEALDACMASGCDGYLGKPVDRGSVRAIADRFLDTRGRRPMRMLVRISHAELDIDMTPDFFFGYTVDISDGGMLVETPEAVKAAEALDLQFFLPSSSQKVATRGRVVRVTERPAEASAPPSSGRDVGIEFVSTTSADRDLIRDFLTRRDRTAKRS